MSYPLENALFQWEDGWRVFQGLRATSAERRRADRVIVAIDEELRRRVGSTFRAAELAESYASGTDWCLQAAMSVAPGLETDPQSLADAAFWIYLRRASDFAGGRQLPSEAS